MQRDARRSRPNQLLLFALLAALLTGCADTPTKYVAADQVRPTYSPNHPGGHAGADEYDPNANVVPSPVESGVSTGDAQGVPVDFGFDPEMVDLRERYERLTSDLEANTADVMPFMLTLSRNIMGLAQNKNLDKQPRIRQAMEDMQRHVQDLQNAAGAADQPARLKQAAGSMATTLEAIQTEAGPEPAPQVQAVRQAANGISASRPVPEQAQAVRTFLSGSLDAIQAMSRPEAGEGNGTQEGQGASGSERPNAGGRDTTGTSQGSGTNGPSPTNNS